MDDGDKIVGHKTFSDGHGGYRHEPLTKREGDAIWTRCEQAKAKRAADMPDEKSAIEAMWSAHYRLEELGWRNIIYCPKDGSSFHVIEPGSTGIFDGRYDGEWPNGSWWVDDKEMGPCPSHPILFKLYPEDQAKEDARKAAAYAKYHSEDETKS